MTDDAEHDAWLRQALRHAPDAGATPPSVVSAAILAEARAAAARPAAASRARRSRASIRPLRAFWDWLARPPVAAGFASVMAATLVGLMWWDRPIDETLPRAPALERSEATRAPAAAAPAAPAVLPASSAAPAPTARTDGATTAAATATAPTPAPQFQREAQPEAKREAKVAAAADADRASAKDAPVKERAAPRRSDAAVAFPSSEGERERTDAEAARAPAADAKKEAVPALAAPATAPAPAPAAAPAFAAAPAPFAAQRAAPPTATAIVPAPAQSGRLSADEARSAASGRGDVAAAAKSVAPRSAVAEARPSEADALAPSGNASRGEPLARLRRDGGTTTATPLAPLLAALSGERNRASRQTESGASTALEPAWRDWLVDLDAAATGRWRRAADLRERFGAEAEKHGGPMLRLDIDGRPAAIVRIDGTTARIETFGAAPEHWQASLAPAAAERLHATLGGLPP